KEEIPVVGRIANDMRKEIEDKLDRVKTKFIKEAKKEKRKKEKIDISIDTDDIKLGDRHCLVKTIDELKEIFISMGITGVKGLEIESVKNTFDALNSPENHPSRDFSDTFYLNEELLLRTHTSPVQIRAMKEMGVPLKIISAGRTFRFDDVDDTHSPM